MTDGVQKARFFRMRNVSFMDLEVFIYMKENKN